MTEKAIRISRASGARRRPLPLAIAGVSASGTTTVTSGLVEALGPGRCASLSTGDYRRLDRAERPHRGLARTATTRTSWSSTSSCSRPPTRCSSPDQHHCTGLLGRVDLVDLVEPNDLVIVEKLLPLDTEVSRTGFDITVYPDPDEGLRQRRKLRRDALSRGYTVE